jgi:DNA-binding IclR family transcriptional regulator
MGGFVPRGSKKVLLSVFDAQAIQVLETLAKAPKSFTEALEKTMIPKATLHRTLVNLAKSKFVKKVGGRYAITSDGGLLIESFERLRARSMLKITDDGLRRVLEQAHRTLRMERSGFSRVEQFESVQEAVEGVEVIEVPA